MTGNTPSDNRMADNPVMDFIVLAAGAGSRFKHTAPADTAYTATSKPFISVSGQTVIEHCIDRIAQWQGSGMIILVHPPQLQPAENGLLQLLKTTYAERLELVAGGQERADSVANGMHHLKQIKPHSAFVAIHDSARPFIPSNTLDRLFEAVTASADAAIIPVLPVADTIKLRHETGDIETINRDRLFRAQTPQCFETPLFLQLMTLAHQASELSVLTDDCQYYERAGYPVKLVEGDRLLEKITVFDDLQNLTQEKDLMSLPAYETVNGTGFDVHRFDTSKSGPVMICGIAVEHPCGLDAHSDGDVGLHAICDALFGAMSDGDIGSHFPPSDMRWKDKASSHFCEYAIDRLRQIGGRLLQIDVTLICETPKIGPYRQQMREQIAKICAVDIRRVSVKATTSEQMGFTGRKEGLAAMASCTIARPGLDNLPASDDGGVS